MQKLSFYFYFCVFLSPVFYISCGCYILSACLLLTLDISYRSPSKKTFSVLANFLTGSSLPRLYLTTILGGQLLNWSSYYNILHYVMLFSTMLYYIIMWHQYCQLTWKCSVFLKTIIHILISLGHRPLHRVQCRGLCLDLYVYNLVKIDEYIFDCIKTFRKHGFISMHYR